MNIFHTLLLAVCFATDNQMFQYFITVVPTRLNTYKISADTHQFSVTERVSEKQLKPYNTTPRFTKLSSDKK